MYNDILKNLGQEQDEVTPEPQPTAPMPTQPERQERSREEIAAANKIRMKDRLAGKYTIQGQIVGQQIPEFTGDQKGINSVISKFVTGKESTDVFEGLGKLGKVSIFGALDKFNDKGISSLVVVSILAVIGASFTGTTKIFPSFPRFPRFPSFRKRTF